MIPVIRVGPCRVRGEMVKETDHGTRPISQMNRDKRVGIMTMTKAGIVNSVYDRLDITKKDVRISERFFVIMTQAEHQSVTKMKSVT